MTTATLSQARELKRDRLQQLVRDVAEGNPSPDEVITRAESAGVEIDVLSKLVENYQRRQRAIADQAEIECLREEQMKLEGERKLLSDAINGLVAKQRAALEAAREPVRKLNERIESLNQKASRLRHDSTTALRETESPELNQRLDDLHKRLQPLQERIKLHESEVDRLDSAIVKTKAELSAASEIEFQTDRQRELLAAAAKRLENMRQQRRKYRQALHDDRDSLAPFEEERERLMSLKNDPMGCFAPAE
ncbi:MAG: hypothetical protein GXX96_27845 [Planctomycetaceae bacterium]|nr:hypothetical protein [Planctomycetaceae bacterium]